MFVLLDLLGSIDPWPRVPSYFLTTHWAYQAMAKIEKRMRDLGVLESVIPKGEKQFLPDGEKRASSFSRGYIEDDHIPFMARGVEILHIITSPFPNQWHNQKGIPDDGEHLSIPVCDDWAKIVTAFAAEWMDVAEFMPKQKKLARREENGKTEL
jgi:glutaminyl-peptide cyclotransferase